MRFFSSKTLALTLTVVYCLPIGAAPLYSVIDLGSSRAIGINTSGQVLTDSFIYQNGVDISLPAGFQPGAINDLGIVAGDLGGTTYQLALYSNGVVTPLAGLTGLIPSALNSAGQIAGNTEFTYSSFFYSGGNVTVFSYTPGVSETLPRGMNAQGVIVGFYEEMFVPRHAYSYSNGQLTSLSVPAVVSEADAVNNAGLITGYYAPSPTNAATTGIFLYDSSGFHSLGPAFGASSQEDVPIAINNAGDIVGTSQLNVESRAWVYVPGSGFADLNDLIPADSGWQLTSAIGINDSGQIIGEGSLNGHGYDSYLLTPTVTPTPEPRTLLLLLTGIAVTAAFHVRTRSQAHRCVSGRNAG